jgi:hypothetical protein
MNAKNLKSDAQVEREQLIRRIDDHYPADAKYPNIQARGRELMLQAIAETWRSLPLETLRTYARLCQ